MSERNRKKRLTHVDAEGRARMVDVSNKAMLERRAVASAVVSMSEECSAQVVDNSIGKGDVLAAAELAGIMAAKRTAGLIPLCHPLRLDHVEVECLVAGSSVRIRASVSCRERTGVEMEALTAVSVAALTVFDMCKAVDPAMVIGPIRVETKIKDGTATFDRSTIHGQD